jgi:hypothetical protein
VGRGGGPEEEPDSEKDEPDEQSPLLENTSGTYTAETGKLDYV